MKNKKATLRMLAQALDIHVSTVSRVLQGDDAVAAKAASPKTIKRIRDLAKEYGYTPNPYAISLKTDQSKWIGVTVPRLSDYIWATIYEGVEEYALECNYYTYVSNSYDDPGLQRRQIAMLGCTIAVYNKTHIAVGYFVGKLPPQLEKFSALLVYAIMMAFFGILLVQGYYQTVRSMSQASPATGIPVGYVMLSMPVSSAISLLYLAEQFVKECKKRNATEPSC